MISPDRMNHHLGTTMYTTIPTRFRHARALRTGLAATLVATAMLTGCTTMVGLPAEPLSIEREEPGVILCQSERAGGGIRLTGKLSAGIWPITRVTLEYRIADPSDPVPATGEDGVLVMSNARSTRVDYRKGSESVSYTIDANAARALQGKVLWYRWIVTYDRKGSVRTDVTEIHRTSLDEAGLPRAPGNPGPDSSVALPVTRRR